MKLQRKELLLFATPLLVLGAVAGSSAWKDRCTDHCEASVGDFNVGVVGVQAAFRDGDKAALQKLSYLIKRCPHSSTYTASLKLWERNIYHGRINISYEPASGILLYNPGDSMSIERWRNVKAQAVHEVAQTGKVEDLKRYGGYRTR